MADRSALPQDAQEAVKKGVIAAKQQDYLLAIRYFEEARKVSPAAPEILYELGQAESRIPGRELRAICWFEAYLAADPYSLNWALVKDQIDVLDVTSRSNLSRLMIQDCTKGNLLKINRVTRPEKTPNHVLMQI